MGRGIKRHHPTYRVMSASKPKNQGPWHRGKRGGISKGFRKPKIAKKPLASIPRRFAWIRRRPGGLQ